MTRTVLASAIVMTVLIPGSVRGGLSLPAEEDVAVSTIRPHQPGQDLFRSALSEDLEWKPFPAFPPTVRLAVIVGHPSEAGPYTIRVRVPRGVKLMPHRHPEDRVYTVISGVFYIGLGDRFDADSCRPIRRAASSFCPVPRLTSIGRNPVNTSRR